MVLKSSETPNRFKVGEEVAERRFVDYYGSRLLGHRNVKKVFAIISSTVNERIKFVGDEKWYGANDYLRIRGMTVVSEEDENPTPAEIGESQTANDDWMFVTWSEYPDKLEPNHIYRRSQVQHANVTACQGEFEPPFYPGDTVDNGKSEPKLVTEIWRGSGFFDGEENDKDWRFSDERSSYYAESYKKVSTGLLGYANGDLLPESVRHKNESAAQTAVAIQVDHIRDTIQKADEVKILNLKAGEDKLQVASNLLDALVSPDTKTILDFSRQPIATKDEMEILLMLKDVEVSFQDEIATGSATTIFREGIRQCRAAVAQMITERAMDCRLGSFKR